MCPKTPFVLSDNRIYDVAEYCACYEQGQWEGEITTHFGLIQRLHNIEHGPFNLKKTKWKKVPGLSGSPLSFMVVISIEDVLEVHPKLPPPEDWLLQVVRYSVLCWLENNGLSAHHRDPLRPIILRPFSS